MSISELSSTMQKAIIDRLRKRLKATTLDDISEYDTDTIREITNRRSSGYEAVLSRGNLESLSQQFSNEARFKGNSEFKKVSKIAQSVIELEELAKEAGVILSNPLLFNNFVAYLASGSAPTFEKSKGELAYAALSDNIKAGRLSAEPSSRDIIIFKENHGDLAKTFRQFLETADSGILPSGPKVLDFIKEQLDAGHLVGIFNIRLKRILNLRSASKDSVDMFSISNTKTNNDELTTLLNAVNSLFIQADYISSNTVLDPDIFLAAEKRVYSKDPSVTVELQLSLKNKDAGNRLASLSRSLNDLITAIRGRDNKVRGRIDAPGAKLALEKFLKGVSKLSADTAKTAKELSEGIDISKAPKTAEAINSIFNNTDTISKLIGAKGSDSIKESILYSMVAGILGNAQPKEQVTKLKNKSTGTSKKVLTKSIKPKQSKVSSKSPTSKVVANSIKVSTTNLVSLQNLINANLAEKIKENMGDGNARNVLNLRSGRLAESAQVERMSESRAGMITAFYSYMKNPYATFSVGGRQQDPKSRDPKLLISKSIREIAAQQVGNRLRSVLV